MREMIIERSIEIKGMLSAEQVRLQCQLKYQNEDGGKRAIGNIYIRGIYFDGERKRPIREIVVLDVLAPNDKLIVDEEFAVELIDSSYDVKNQMLKLMIKLNVYVIIDEQQQVDMVVDTEEANMIHEYKENIIELIEENNIEKVDEIEVIGKEYELDEFCQLDTKLCCRLILLKENSSYEILASKFCVDIQMLKLLNKNKKLDSGTLVLLPDK